VTNSGLKATRFDRAFGVLLGQCAGDSLGAQVEFSGAASIAARFPKGVREMTGGGPHRIIPGQVTDDSELALALARSIAVEGDWIEEAVAAAYVDWLKSGPFDCGSTCGGALSRVDLDREIAPQIKVNAAKITHSQANGSLMRASPLGVLFARHLAAGTDMKKLVEIARADSALTHAHPNCQQAVAVFTLAIARLVNSDLADAQQRRQDAYAFALEVNNVADATSSGLVDAKNWIAGLLEDATKKPTENGINADSQQGWVKHGFQNAFYQLLHAPDFEEGVVATIALGGDTDTNAAISGPMLGALFGAEGIPERWKKTVLNSHSYRPATYHADDVEELAKKILQDD
jgi:ADP-ribosyl-[dinitrogen reductase] hydrolase